MAEPGPVDDGRKRWSVKRNHPFSLLRTTQTHLFLCLPPEMREHVWAALDSTDVPIMRQVCRLFKFDMEQVLGVRVVMKYNPPPIFGPHISRGNTNMEFFQLKAQWLQSVIVRSLELGYVGEFMNYSEIILKNPFMLRELVLKIGRDEFGDPVKLTNLKRLLHSTTRLSRLEIGVWMENGEETAHFESILSEALTCLEKKVLLKDFKFRIHDSYGIEGAGYRIMPDPEYVPTFQIPMQLNSIYLDFPLPSRKHHLDWQAFLNTQTQLTKIHLTVGLTSWHFFETALRNSVSTLRDLAVRMCSPTIIVYKDADLRSKLRSYYAEYHGLGWNDGDGNEGNQQEDLGSFDWSILSQIRLESLAAYYVPPRGKYDWAVSATNFSSVQLTSLVKIDLYGYHLTLDDLTRIFIQGNNLASIEIENWNLVTEREDRNFCLMQTLKIWILIAVALQGKHFIKFRMADRSVVVSPIPMSIVSAVNEVIGPHNRLVYRRSSIQKF